MAEQEPHDMERDSQNSSDDEQKAPLSPRSGLKLVTPRSFKPGKLDCDKQKTRKSWCRTHKLAPDECLSFGDDNKDEQIELSKMLVLYNPFSGNGNGEKAFQDAHKIFKKAKIETNVMKSEYAGHFKQIIKDTDITLYDAVCVVGGDGSFYEVINSTIEKYGDLENLPPLALVPGGTGNSVMSSMGAKSPKDCAHKITRGIVRSMDVGRCIDNNDRTIYWTNGLWWGLGVDAGIQAENMRWLGKMRYDVSGLIHIMKGKNYTCQMKLDGAELEGDFQLVMIQNNQHAGAGLRCAPYARLDDGLLDVVFCENKGRVALLNSFDQLKKGGSHIYAPQNKYVRFKKLEFTSDMSSTLVIDGEPEEVKMPLVIECLPHFLRLLLPI